MGSISSISGSSPYHEPSSSQNNLTPAQINELNQLLYLLQLMDSKGKFNFSLVKQAIQNIDLLLNQKPPLPANLRDKLIAINQDLEAAEKLAERHHVHHHHHAWKKKVENAVNLLDEILGNPARGLSGNLSPSQLKELKSISLTLLPMQTGLIDPQTIIKAKTQVENLLQTIPLASAQGKQLIQVSNALDDALANQNDQATSQSYLAQAINQLNLK